MVKRVGKIIVGASLGGFKGLTVEKAIEIYLKLSNDLNLNAVEIRFEKEGRRPALWHWEADKRLKDFIDNFEVVGVHLPFVYLNPISQNPYIKETSMAQLRSAIEKASELDVDYCVMHTRGLNYALTPEQEFGEWEEIVEELTETAKRHSILLALENADFLHDLSSLTRLVRKINSKWLKITFDVGHAHIRRLPSLSSYPLKDLALRVFDLFLPLYLIKKNMPYEKYGSLKSFIKSEKDLIAAIHVHDYDGRRDHLPIGDGKINFSFLPELNKFFKGPYILEVEFQHHYEDFRKNYYRFMELMKA
ncbi:hypothetical protein DRP04_03755 [Archaeoglobales archaeon]|nr:MAG: hypothetical protein DRP04_03755 [Archaeoglobales archaeon]